MGGNIPWLGKPHLEQGQIGGRNPRRATGRGRGALPSPRVGRTSRRVTDDLRWMAITAGASAPELLVREVVERIAERFDVTEQPVDGVEERMVFKLPADLRAA